jgi:hypothetical protein
MLVNQCTELYSYICACCAGICDEDTGMCWCDGKFKHIPAPAGSPYGTPPIQMGRPMHDTCKPKNVSL